MRAIISQRTWAGFLLLIGATFVFIAVTQHARHLNAIAEAEQDAAAEGTLLAIDVDPSWYRQDVFLGLVNILGSFALWSRRRSIAAVAVYSQLLILATFVNWVLWTRSLRESAGITDQPVAEWRELYLYGAQWWHLAYAGLSLIMLVALTALLYGASHNAPNKRINRSAHS